MRFIVVLLGRLSGDLPDGTRDEILRAEVVVVLGSDADRGVVRPDEASSPISANQDCVENPR